MTEKHEFGRLALRVEGDYWNAYYALTDTMEGAIHLGSILAKLAESPKAKEAFIALMSDVVADFVEHVAGERPTMRLESAPEHERSGKA